MISCVLLVRLLSSGTPKRCSKQPPIDVNELQRKHNLEFAEFVVPPKMDTVPSARELEFRLWAVRISSSDFQNVFVFLIMHRPTVSFLEFAQRPVFPKQFCTIRDWAEAINAIHRIY